MTPCMDRLIAVSRAIVDKIEHEGRSGTKVSLIYNGVDLERYDHPGAVLHAPRGVRHGGRLPDRGRGGAPRDREGHPTLLDAWPLVLQSVPSAYLLVVGEGSRRDSLEQQAAELRIAHRVVFTGRRDDIPAVTAALDVAVLPSYREAKGLTVLEAMALSRPVVASNVGGIPEMIEDGVSGLLVPPHDAPALASAIVRLLTDHSLADVIARAGQRRARPLPRAHGGRDRGHLRRGLPPGPLRRVRRGLTLRPPSARPAPAAAAKARQAPAGRSVAVSVRIPQPDPGGVVASRSATSSRISRRTASIAGSRNSSP